MNSYLVLTNAASGLCARRKEVDPVPSMNMDFQGPCLTWLSGQSPELGCCKDPVCLAAGELGRDWSSSVADLLDLSVRAIVCPTLQFALTEQSQCGPALPSGAPGIGQYWRQGAGLDGPSV